MNAGLGEADYQLLLAGIEGIHRCRRLENFPHHALAELRKLVECRMACYAELDYARQRAVNVFDPPTGLNHEWFAKLVHEHPVLNYFLSTGDGQALKISDFLSVQEFHRLALYQQAFRLVNAEDEMGFGVHCERRFILGFSFHRGERSFTERDRLVLNLFRPHVIQAYLRLEELAGCHELQRDLQAALREKGIGVLILNGAREVSHATPGAWAKLAGYWPNLPEELMLPDSLSSWAYGQEDNTPFYLGAEPARLIIRRKRQNENRLVLTLSEETSAQAAARVSQFNLTPREHEVLRWIAQGKSNSEIATILGLSVSTAKTHVERILAKLGAENRTAAAAILRRVSF